MSGLSNLQISLIDKCLAVLRRIAPPACLLCGEVAGDCGLCRGCREQLPALNPQHCPLCAAPTPGSQTCGRCLQHPPQFDRVVAALEYAHPADALVCSLKYQGSLGSARPLAYGLADALEQEPYPDLVLPMPLAAERQAQRGFNQAAEIARHVCREFGIPTTISAVHRVRAGVPQALLPWKERARNVRGVFRCTSDLSGMRVAVVDDVLTTGATLDALAAELKRAGARDVVGWIAARAVAQP
jgi:ComF family protein